MSFPPLSLSSETHALSLTRGGSVSMLFDAGESQAMRSYWLLGSAAGNRPGVPLGGLHLPLNPDSYTAFTLTSPNTPPLATSTGKLDANGRARVSFAIPPGLPTALIGTSLHHAYVVYDAGSFRFASNAASIAFLR